MRSEAGFLAIDLGAESGRALAGRFDGARVLLDEVHRFANEPVRLPGGLHWDILRIHHEVKRGIAKAAAGGQPLSSLGIDAWGVDYGLLDRGGALLGDPYHYRDARTDGVPERAFARVPWERIYRTTGIQLMPINTLYQLVAAERSAALVGADILLTIPDLLGYWLSGEKRCEYTIASTTQLLDVQTRDWAWELIERLDIPAQIFAPLVDPGSRLGGLLPVVAEETGLSEGFPVIAVASHDTASAVVAVPAEDEDFAYISSGTWSLVGVETREPVASDEAMAHNFTNEGGFGGTVRLLKNVMGLWLLQECRRTWARTVRDLSYEDIGRLAEDALEGGPLVDPDHPEFLAPGDMPARIRRYCAATGQEPPEEMGALARCVLESLALKYRWALERARALSGKRVHVLHVVGGGARNDLLCRFTAGACGLPVLAGPAEATALGNVLVQMHALGHVGGLSEMRALARASSDVREYTPEGDWDERWERFQRIRERAEATRV